MSEFIAFTSFSDDAASRSTDVTKGDAADSYSYELDTAYENLEDTLYGVRL